MTTQMPDWIRADGREHAIRAQIGAGLYSPAADGIRLDVRCTACYRGHHELYEIAGGELRLRRLGVFALEPPPIDGVVPVQRNAKVWPAGDRPLSFFGLFSKRELPALEDLPTCEWIYEGLDRPIAFTGWISTTGSILHRKLFVFDQGRLVLDRAEQRRVTERSGSTSLHAGALSLLDGSGELSISP